MNQNIRKNGYDYKLIKYNALAAIYQQTFEGKHLGYEVFIRKVKESREVNGILLPAKEKFPADSDFGKTAWSIKQYERAIDKFNELSKIVHNSVTSML